MGLKNYRHTEGFRGLQVLACGPWAVGSFGVNDLRAATRFVVAFHGPEPKATTPFTKPEMSPSSQLLEHQLASENSDDDVVDGASAESSS